MLRRALVGFTVAVSVLAGPPLAHALSRQQANAIAVRALKPPSGRRGVIVFGLSAPLKPADWVMTVDPPRPGLTTYSKPIRTLGRRTWLFWEDLQPYARFSHPSALLLVDDATGKVRQRTKMRWIPLVDGRRPPFLQSRAAYDSSRYRVFSREPRIRAGSSRRAAGRLRRLLAHAAVPPGVFVGDCIVMIGATNDPLMQNDFPAMQKFGKDFGIPVYYASTGPRASTDPPAPGSTPPDGNDLKRNVRDLVQRGICDDVFIYMSGHGGDTGPPSVSTGVTEEYTMVGREATFTWHDVTAGQIVQILEQNPEASFKLAVDSCYSGRFIPVVADKGKLVVAETSSAATETSSGSIDAEGRTDNPDHVGEFTNGLLAGMRRFLSDDAAVAAAIKSRLPLLAVALSKGHTLGVKSDLAASRGYTHSQSWVAGNPPLRPLGVEILGASYLHPKDSTVSYVCATVKTEAGASVHLSVTGPGTAKADYPNLFGTATADADGKATVTFSITRAGDWTFTVYATRLSDGAVSPMVSLTYHVPDPPPPAERPAKGPFDCPVFYPGG